VITFGAGLAGVCSRADFRNSQADPSHSAAKQPVSGQIGAVKPNPAVSAITTTNS
jgi:hypothetical protein